jgi:uncharacterized surface protein with fasciclin (FAS1) repeats
MTKKIKSLLLLSCVALLLVSCEKELHDRYKTPDNINGTIYKQLKASPNHQLFAKAIELVDMKNNLDGRAPMTVFAPNDDSMKKWLASKNASSIEDVDKADLEIAINVHLVRNVFSNELINQMNDIVPRRLKTFAKKPISFETSDNKEYALYHGEKFMPVFTPNVFAEDEISDPNYNIQKIFNKAYNGSLMYGNSNVTETLTCTNGYLNYVDDVVKTSSNVEDWIQNNSEYSLMADLYQRYSFYDYDSRYSEKYAQYADSIFIKFYAAGNINQESTAALFSGSLLTYSMVEERSFFMIKDASLRDYLERELLNSEVSSINEINPVTSIYFLRNLLGYETYWPENINSDIFRNQFGAKLSIDIDADVDTVAMCSNGLVYGLNKVPEIEVFNSVIDLPFKYPSSDYMLYLASYSQTMNELLDARTSKKAYLADNDAWKRAGITIDIKDPKKLGDEEFTLTPEGRDVDATPVNVSRWVLGQFITNEIPFNDEFDLGLTLNNFQVVLVKEDEILGGGDIYLNESSAQIISTGVERSNGTRFQVDDIIKPSLSLCWEIISKDDNYAELYKLFQKVGGFKTNSETGEFGSCPFIPSGPYYTIFAPTNEAIIEALDNGEIPIDEINPDLSQEQIDNPNTPKHLVYSELANWLKYHFVPINPNTRDNYYLPNENQDAPVESALLDLNNSTQQKKVYYELSLLIQGDPDTGVNNGFSVTGQNGASANVLKDRMGLCNKSLIYSIDNVISFK